MSDSGSSDLIVNPNAKTIFDPREHYKNLSNTKDDWMSSTQSKATIGNTGLGGTQWGGMPGGAQQASMHSLGSQWQDQDMAGRGFNQMMSGAGQSVEDSGLNDAYRENRYGDQANAMELQRQAAMGRAPSFAQLQMRQGLDQSLGAQQGIAGSARGAGALALAGGNMAGNAAALQNQGAMNSSMLRAQEMANARGAYGDMSNQVGAQSLQRLGLKNNMAMNNANNQNAYNLGVGQVGASYGATGLGYEKAGQDPWSQQLASDTSRANSVDTLNANAEIERAKLQERDRVRKHEGAMGMAKGLAGVVGSFFGGGGGGMGGGGGLSQT